MTAAIVRRNKILAIGHNSYSSNQLSRRFKKHEKAVCVHGEIAAIHNFLKKYEPQDLAKCKLYVVRAKQDRSGKWVFGKSAPCKGCRACIEFFGIKEVIHG